MTAKEFLKSKNIWTSMYVSDMSNNEKYFDLSELLEEYANQELQLGGVSKCEKSCKNCKYLNGPNKKCIDCDDNYSQWEKSNIC